MKRILAIALALLAVINVPVNAATTDHPTSSAYAPVAGTVLTVGEPVVIRGHAQNGEQGGIIQTEISLDGGDTWQFAAGVTENWSFTFTPAMPGAVTIMSRASTANTTEKSAGAITRSVVGGTTTCPCTFWQPDIPGLFRQIETDPDPVELGLRFQPDRDGFVTGLYLIHYPLTTEPQVGHLWSADGRLLAEATIAGTDAYIPRITFDQPVAVRANQTYVVSYFATSGRYPQTPHYFTEPITQAPFATDIDAGVYSYGGGFPIQAWQSANYGVGPIFSS